MNRSRAQSRRKWTGVILAVLIIIPLILVGAGASLPLFAQFQYGPYSDHLTEIQVLEYSCKVLLSSTTLTKSGENPEDFQLTVNPGDGPAQIAQQLERMSIIPDSRAFINYLIYKGYDRSIKTGTFVLIQGLDSIQIAERIIDPTNDETIMTILPGWRLEEIAEQVNHLGFRFSKEEFLAGMKDPDENILPLNASSLEGYLLPGKYSFLKTASVNEVLETIKGYFNNAIDSKMRNRFEENNLSLHQAVVLASIVQRESVASEEMPIIASVFYNRINLGMKLESDPTVQYAIGYYPEATTFWKNPFTFEDLGIQSFYNTYIYDGLPPGPICNPGLEALNAVAYPEKTSYYFFRASCDNSGTHQFSETFAEHQSNSCTE